MKTALIIVSALTAFVAVPLIIIIVWVAALATREVFWDWVVYYRMWRLRIFAAWFRRQLQEDRGTDKWMAHATHTNNLVASVLAAMEQRTMARKELDDMGKGWGA